jgi:creatinine amidohydrolase
VNPFPTATAIDEQNRCADVAVLPVGSFEQHGGHLPLSTDSLIASVIAERLANAYDLLRLPPITIACSHEHEGLLSGTVSISARTLYAIVTDVAESLERMGIRKLVVVSAHGGNYVLSNVVQEANVSERRMSLYPGRDDWNQARADAGCESSSHDDMHAGELETSILLHSAPELVRDDWKEADHNAPDRPDLLTLGTAGYTTSGVIGQPSLARQEKGAAILDSLTRSFGRHLAMLCG